MCVCVDAFPNSASYLQLLTLSNYWSDFGGAPQYAQWARNIANEANATSVDAFFTSPFARQVYKTFVSTLLNRVNTVTGVAYKNESSIFGFDCALLPKTPSSRPSSPSTCSIIRPGRSRPLAVCNEPRHNDMSGDTLHSWFVEMSSFIKTVDQFHSAAPG